MVMRHGAGSLLALGILLAAGCGGGPEAPRTRLEPGEGPVRGEDLAWSPRLFAATTRPAMLHHRVVLDVPPVQGSWALDLATGVPAGQRAAFRVSGKAGGTPLLFEVVDGGESGRWIPRRINLPGPGAYVLEVLPDGPWARRMGREAPTLAAFSLPRLIAAGPGGAGDHRPNLLLISADTLRADRLGCYGAERPTSPAIDRLAAEGLLVLHTYAASNWTLPSHYSLFSGLDPSAHGVDPDLIDVGGYLRPAQKLHIRGSERETMLAEVLGAAGYRTRAFTENGWVSARFGFHQGFDAYDSHQEGSLERTRERALAWLRENAERGPWFLFLHTYEVHQPYHAPEPYKRRFMDPAHVGFALPGIDVPIQDLNRFKIPSFPPTAGDRDAFRALYDGEVLYLDDFVGAIRDALVKTGVERRTILVFTSDHGEELFERGGFDHIHSLHEEVSRVPLVIWAPGRLGPPPGTRLGGGPLSLTDLGNTLLGLMGLADDHRLGSGRDLSRFLVPGSPGGVLPDGAPVFAESKGRSSEPLRSVWIEMQGRRYKYLRQETRAGVREWLYDLDVDPGETRDRAAGHPELLARLRAEVVRREQAAAVVREALGVTEEAELDEETREALRGLGYLR